MVLADQHIVELHHLDAPVQFGEELTVVLKEGLLAVEISCQWATTWDMVNDVVGPHCGSRFPVVTLPGFYVTLHHLGFARSTHSSVPPPHTEGYAVHCTETSLRPKLGGSCIQTSEYSTKA